MVMTDEKVIELYKKANGWSVEGWDKTIKELKQFAALVEAEEREACAKLCEEMASWHGDLVTAAYDSAADAIRKRG
jgi:hypothetical protein